MAHSKTAAMLASAIGLPCEFNKARDAFELTGSPADLELVFQELRSYEFNNGVTVDTDAHADGKISAIYIPQKIVKPLDWLLNANHDDVSRDLLHQLQKKAERQARKEAFVSQPQTPAVIGQTIEALTRMVGGAWDYNDTSNSYRMKPGTSTPKKLRFLASSVGSLFKVEPVTLGLHETFDVLEVAKLVNPRATVSAVSAHTGGTGQGLQR